MAISIEVLVLSDGLKKTSATLRPIRGRSSCAPDLKSDARSRSPSSSSRVKSAVLRKSMGSFEFSVLSFQFQVFPAVVVFSSQFLVFSSSLSLLPSPEIRHRMFWLKTKNLRLRQFPQRFKEQVDSWAPQRKRRQQAQHRWVVGQSGYYSSL